MLRHNQVLYSLLTFVCVLAVNYLIRNEVISLETLFADDLIYLPKALAGTCEIPFRHPIDFTFICYVIGVESVYLGRVIFLFHLALTASLMQYMLVRAGIDSILALLFSLVTFAGAPFLSQTTFITGSYPLHGLFFIAITLIVVVNYLTSPNKHPTGWLTALLLISTLILAGVSATSATLVSLMLLPLAVYSWSSGRDQNQTLLWCSVSVIPASLFIALQFSGLFTNHYALLEGWIKIDITHMGAQALRHYEEIVKILGLPLFLTMVIGSIVGLLIYIYSQTRRLIVRQPPDSPSYEPHALKITLIGISMTAFAVTLAPTLMVNGSAPRYLVTPMTFLFMTVFITLDLIRARLPGKPVKSMLILSGATAAVVSINALYTAHQNAYLKIAVDQQAIREALNKTEHRLLPNAQVVLLIDNNVKNATSGFNHWSTHLARFATSRQDITALIGKRSDLTDYPFVDQYSDHGDAYWGHRDGRAYRKSMVGLQLDRPTLLLSTRNGEINWMDCIVVQTGSTTELYSAGNHGITSWNVDTHGAQPASNNCVQYFTAGVLPAAEEPNGEPLYLDGHSIQSISPARDGAADVPYTFSMTFKAEPFEHASYKFTQTTPPMPLHATPLIIFQVGATKYTVALNCSDPSSYVFNTTSAWTKLSLSVDENRTGTLRINETVVAAAQGCSTPKQFILGRGFLDRFWRGHVADVSFRTAEQHLTLD